ATFPPQDEASVKRFLSGEEQIRGLLAGAPERVSLAEYRANVAAMVAMAKDHGARVILIAPPYGSQSQEPYFPASVHRIPVRRRPVPPLPPPPPRADPFADSPTASQVTDSRHPAPIRQVSSCGAAARVTPKAAPPPSRACSRRRLPTAPKARAAAAGTRARRA